MNNPWRVDRFEQLRHDTMRLAQARARSATRYVVFHGERVFMEPSARAEPMVFSGVQVSDAGIPLDRAVFLGFRGRDAWFAVDAECVDETADLEGEPCSLRQVRKGVSGDVWALLTHARGLLTWNRRYAFCPLCGAPNRFAEEGYVRICSNPDCAKLHFPRTDPAIIVRVTFGDRCLLARQPQFATGMRSVLAGFVEPGETLEEAVAREVYEEVHLAIDCVTYFGSQPWPFPLSLMVAFTAQAQSNAIRIDEREIEAAAWYTREEIHRGVDDQTLILPGTNSISRRLIDDWLKPKS